jgi:hypothetical protein
VRMKAHKGWQTDRDAQRNAIADSMILMATASCEPLKPYRFSSKPEAKNVFKSNFEYLVGCGCKPKALVTALQMANTIAVSYVPSSKQVEPLVKRMRKLADALADLETKSWFVAHTCMSKEQKGRGCQRGVSKQLYIDADEYEDWLRLTGDKVPPPDKLKVEAVVETMRKLADDMIDLESTLFLAIQNWRRPLEDEAAGQRLRERLYGRAEDYKDWLRMARDRVPPHPALLWRVKRVCPILYVKWATRDRPFHERVAALLCQISIHTTAPQLAREVTAFEASHPYSADYIRRSLASVHCGKKTYRVLPIRAHFQAD